MNIASILYIVMAVIFAVLILRNTLNRKMLERESLVWLLITLAMLVFAFFPGVLDLLADAVGVDYPPALLFLIVSLVFAYVLFRQSMHISRLDKQVKELMHYISVSRIKIANAGDKAQEAEPTKFKTINDKEHDKGEPENK
jgi:hypothetical protein